MGKDEKLLTYKRRSRLGLKRKNLEESELVSSEHIRQDGEADTRAVSNQYSCGSGKLFGKPAREAAGFSRLESLSKIDAWKRVTGAQKRLTPKRIIGQYFLDLGQSDFSHSTCPTCGLFYARGHENDEKVHKSFHRNFVQGIIFKGWQSERVASRLDDKGNRVIVVLAEDTHHQAKVREVIDVMELELGLTPGWLLQRPCKVYLFISASKKIVGCLMAEPIQSAFRVVPDQCHSLGNGSVPRPCGLEDRKPTILTTEPQKVPCESSSHPPTSTSELPATKKTEIDSRGQASIEGRLHLPLESSSNLTSEDAMSVSTGNSPECKPKVKEVPFNTVKEESVSVGDKVKKSAKITDFFTLRNRPAGSQGVFKPDWKTKPDVRCQDLIVVKEEQSQLSNFVTGQDQQSNCRRPKIQERKVPSHVTEAAEGEGKPSATVSGKIGVKDGDFKEGDSGESRKPSNNVMVFGNVMFSRETVSTKRGRTERTQDLGSAILCTKTPVPAVCGVRVIWASHMERRKGIATHLLDAMRKTFCLGVVLEPSQLAFSQPTPEGRKFAVRYCKTAEFLVYTTS